MSKPLIKILSLLLFVAISNFGFSQVTGYWIQLVAEHDGMVGDYDLTGYCTYDVYVTVASPDDNLTTITGSGVSCPEVDTTLYFHFPSCGLFQHPDAGLLSWDVLCPQLPSDESLNYDSYLTIGSYCFGQGANIVTDFSCPADVEGTFEMDATPDPFDGGDIDVEVGFWGVFGPNPENTLAMELPGQPGVYGVRIMRYTTCCGDGQCNEIEFNFTALLVGDPGVVVNSADGDVCPCDELEATMVISDPIDCFGDVATIDIDTGTDPYGPYTYEIVDAVTDIPIDTVDTNIFSGLEAGNEYYVVVKNVAGCDDTTAVLVIPDVELFTVSATLTEDILCAGDAGQICYEIEGGTPDFMAELIDQDGGIYNPVAGVDPFDGCFETLPCGEYTLEVEDGNGCTAEAEPITVSCAELIQTDLTVSDLLCFEDNTGCIEGTVTGGTGELTINWYDSNGDVLLSTITGTTDTPLDITLCDLPIGNYYYEIEDVNGCSDSDDYDIDQPTLLEIALTPTDVSCAGLCDASILVEGSGGTGAYVMDCEDGMEDLCVGEYTCTVTDANGCMATDSATIVEPPPVFFEFDFSLISCAGVCDGAVTLSNFIGGTGDVEVSISPISGTIDNNYPEYIALTDLCSDTYIVEITDNDGQCTFTQEVFIPEPLPLIGNITATDVSCFGEADGTVDIQCTGDQGPVTITGIGDGTQTCPELFIDQLAGVYNIQLVDSVGCLYDEIIEITEPDSLILSITNVVAVSCGGYNDGEIEANTTGGTGAIEWFFNEDTEPIDYPQDLDGLATGVYDITVVDANGCADFGSAEILEPDPIQVFTLIDQITCTGMTDGSAVLTLTGGTGDLDISFEQPDPDYTVNSNVITLEDLPEGDYPYVVTDGEGCTIVDTLSMTPEFESDIEYEIFTTPVTCWNEDDGTATVALTGGVDPITYSWNDPLQQDENIAVGLTNDTYLVTIEDGQGCIIQESVLIEMNVGCFFIADALSPNNDGYNDEWVVGGLEFFPQSTVQVFNRWGQLLFESKGYPNRWDGTFDGKKLPMADYYYIIVYDPSADPILGTVTIKY